MSRTRIKFCGITSIDDALAAADEGADAIGLILVPESLRGLTLATAAAIAEASPPLITRVALFRNAAAGEVWAALNHFPIDLLQFHGDESSEFCAQFGRRWIKAVPMGALPGAAEVMDYLARFSGAAGFVFDSHGGARSGGSGHTFDWAMLPSQSPRPMILAGGLHPVNVAEAVRQLRPWAVDVSSGIESAPGRKDRAKMRAFISEVQRAGTD